MVMLALSCLYIAVATATSEAVPTVTPLFVPSARYPCFRQPAILTAGSAILAFAENRNVSACAPEADPATNNETMNVHDNASYHPREVGSLLLRRSTDGGSTWLPMQTLSVGNIDFYSVVYDAKAAVVWLMLQYEGITVLSSTNQGATWNAEYTLNVSNVLKNPMNPSIKLSKPAVGHGIQIASDLCGVSPCREAGRLVLPFVCTNTSATGSHSDKGCITCNSCLLISDDAGRSWRIGAVGQQGTRESQVAQLNSTTATATLYATERNMGAHPGHRQYAFSADGGANYFKTGTDNTLTAPVTAHWTGIVGSVLRVGERLLYSGPASRTLRKTLAIHTSSDGQVWSAPRVLWPSFAGYSDMAALPGSGPDAAIIILENGLKTFADQVSVAKIPRTWLHT